MKWRTEVDIKEDKGYLKYEHSLISMGSCFSDEIGVKLKNNGFDIKVNPAGILFNPVSIMQLIQNSLDEKIREDMILERDGIFYHYGLHSSVSGTSKTDLLKQIEFLQFKIKKRLSEADHLFLTFGTAFLWRLQNDNSAVANCHKMPANLFKKELVDHVRLEDFSVQLFQRLKELNPKLKILLTVSPVRHSREGLHENNLSKSTLLLFANKLANTFDNIQYFPAYELVMDELRDYRFFKEDLVHPNEQAVDYVFEKFRSAFFDQKTIEQFELHDKIRKAEAHDHMNASEESIQKHESYISDLKEKLQKLG